jgi:Tol biopolymer transport system component
MGQEIPGLVPERFAPGIIPDDLHSVPVFTYDGKSVYYKTLEGNDIMVSHEKNDKWTKPKPLFDDSVVGNSDDPCISPTGDRIFFSSYNKDANRDFIYYYELANETKSGPKLPAGQLNELDLHWQFSMASNGNVYYASNGNIYISEYNSGVYAEPLRLDTAINTDLSECTPYISPDETLLIFSRSVNGKPDLFMSIMTKDGNWSPAKALGPEINTEHHEMCPRISEDGKYLFFLSSREGLFSAYWVDARILKSEI